MTTDIVAEAELVAEAMRNDLEAAGIEATVEIKIYGTSSHARIVATDATPKEMNDIRSMLEKYLYGRFDGAWGRYEVTNTGPGPKVHYLHREVRYSHEVRQAAKEYIQARARTPQTPGALAALRVKGEVPRSFWTSRRGWLQLQSKRAEKK